ncbi:GlcG/HbpS family heme-binding protein [Pseudobacillus badius]|uniref:GlcG/HbpS family heme-binding protein n=1 Tax=Bacillus badius TaxID=1455 RepID=UPI0007B040EF|nr:heme-binding protein [Bacillus badius]KZO00319.1 cobalamin adenosyltransferase [Bacillus badius]KZR59732.1 cobalamin adenosyltransferase [Bacillus badius]MED0668369.1 heme-binding protein [Bacillus badius]OCS86487.1 cobalamin adenosyltransferase [Bacillus badius]OVE52050.1 cobalamin adenosyltransferase [Bacillus badius]
MKGFIEQKTISSDLAEQMVQAAKGKAKELGIAVNVAIVDGGGNLLAFSRMDRAPLLSIEIAQDKAYTAAAFGRPTHEWYDVIKDKPSLKTGIVHTKRLTVFGGGYPVRCGEDLAGGIGVSGGSLEQDQACCEAALKLITS